MIDVSRQLKPAPLSFEKTISQHTRARIHVDRVPDPKAKPDSDGNRPLITVGHLNRKGRRKADALARRVARRAFRRAIQA